MWGVGYAYIALLCALVLVTFRKGEPMRRTVLTLFAVMIAAYAYSFALGGGLDYSVYMIGVNALACWAIVRHPAARWQSAIGWSLLLQIGLDGGSVASELYFGSSDMWLVYISTVLLAFGQLLMVGGWYLDELAARHLGNSDGHSAASTSRHRGVA